MPAADPPQVNLRKTHSTEPSYHTISQLLAPTSFPLPRKVVAGVGLGGRKAVKGPGWTLRLPTFSAPVMRKVNTAMTGRVNHLKSGCAGQGKKGRVMPR